MRTKKPLPQKLQEIYRPEIHQRGNNKFMATCGQCVHFCINDAGSSWCAEKSELFVHDKGAMSVKKPVGSMDDATDCPLFLEAIPF